MYDRQAGNFIEQNPQKYIASTFLFQNVLFNKPSIKIRHWLL